MENAAWIWVIMVRLTIVQYAGDYREAHERLANGGPSTYQGQRYSLATVGRLAKRHEQVAVVCGQTTQPYDKIMSDGVRAMGCGFNGIIDKTKLIEDVAKTNPTHLIITTPYPVNMLQWAIKRKIPTICIFADSFSRIGWKAKLRSALLSRILQHRMIEWVGNHGINSCLSLQNIGVPDDKILPWDWPPSFRPHDCHAKILEHGKFRIIFVGLVVEAKGVVDLLEAIQLLVAQNFAVSAEIIGFDPEGKMAATAAAMRLGESVKFLGTIPNEKIVEAMHVAHAVIVPSRHTYPEGLPLTIYEALSARTPIIASDHPMFRGVLIDGENSVIFKASDHISMANAIKRISGNEKLYDTISRNTIDTWEKIQLPVRWGDMIENWIDHGSSGKRWLAKHTLASGIYNERLTAQRQAFDNQST